MRDTVKLVIGSIEITNFLSYDIDSNVLIPADAFSCKVSRIDDSIVAGTQFYLYINDTPEMLGIIDKVSFSYSKGSQEMNIEGRDLMGILVDSSVEEFKTQKGMKLKDLAKKLLKNIPYIDTSKIVYGNELKDSGVSSPKKVKKETLKNIFDSTETNICQYETGITIFEALSDYAQRHGLLMWMEPDGTLIFGELKGESDAPEYSFYTYKEGDDRKKNNIISATLTDDISKRYSKITVVAQIQGADNQEAGEQTIKKPTLDKEFPFTKPLVLQSQCSSSKAAAYQVQLEMKKREIEGWRMELTVAGHSQDGNNYRANTVCHVRDEVFGVLDKYLILGRKFTLTREEGPRTQLTIGKLMKGYTVQ